MGEVGPVAQQSTQLGELALPEHRGHLMSVSKPNQTGTMVAKERTLRDKEALYASLHQLGEACFDFFFAGSLGDHKLALQQFASLPLLVKLERGVRIVAIDHRADGSRRGQSLHVAHALGLERRPDEANPSKITTRSAQAG